jgi:hypothetical protein
MQLLLKNMVSGKELENCLVLVVAICFVVASHKANNFEITGRRFRFSNGFFSGHGKYGS